MLFSADCARKRVSSVYLVICFILSIFGYKARISQKVRIVRDFGDLGEYHSLFDMNS